MLTGLHMTSLSGSYISMLMLALTVGTFSFTVVRSAFSGTRLHLNCSTAGLTTAAFERNNSCDFFQKYKQLKYFRWHYLVSGNTSTEVQHLDSPPAGHTHMNWWRRGETSSHATEASCLRFHDDRDEREHSQTDGERHVCSWGQSVKFITPPPPPPHTHTHHTHTQK